MQSFKLNNSIRQLRFQDLPGNGTPIIFIHGLGCASSCDYPRVAADNALAGRRMLLVDLLGSGFSDRPEDFDYGIGDHARTIASLIDGLSLPSVDLFGHSMGGSIAIEVATLHPDRVRRLVLGEPNLDAGGGVFSRPIAAQSEADYIARGHLEAVRSAVAQGNNIWSGSLLASAPLAVYRAAISLVRGTTPSWRQQLAKLTIPRTVIFGERSLPDPDTVHLAETGVEVHIVPNAGHSLAIDNPSGLAEAIKEGLSA